MRISPAIVSRPSANRGMTMNSTNTKKQACPATSKPTSTNHACKCNPCRCGKQPALFEIPPPATVGGGLVDYLLTHDGRSRQDHLAGILQTNRRGIRKQSQDAGGAVLFFSQTEDGGLLHICHANEFEFRQYRAEFESRIRSMQDRLNASIGLWLAMGRAL